MAGRSAAVATLAALLATGCVIPPGGQPTRLTAVATTSAWGSILSQLAGDRVDTRSLVPNPNTDPHDYEPTPADARSLSLARLVVENGAGYDDWARRVLAASPDSRRVVLDVAHLVGVTAGDNPHLWYSPADVDRVVDAVASGLARVDPRDATYFGRQRDRLTQRLTHYHSLVQQIRARFAGVPIGASESIVAPLARTLGLDLVTPPGFLRAVSEGVEPAAADKTAVDTQIRDHRIAAYVYNPQNSTPDVVGQVAAARRAGIPVVAMTETLTPVGATFQDWQVAQLESLQTALRRASGR